MGTTWGTTWRTHARPDGLLAGVRVLDLSIWRPGPYATQLLAELGAEVIKVEPPGGDPMRVYAGLFAALHADKRSVVLDLKQPADREPRARRWPRDADVVVEGYRPGVADRLGVGYDQVRAVNPGVIYCSISGLGQDGPLAAVPGHDLDYAAWAGVLAPEGGPPVVPAVPVADLAGGMAAAFAVCAALVRRDRTGRGRAGRRGHGRGPGHLDRRGRRRRPPGPAPPPAACPATAPSPPPTAGTWCSAC